MGGLLVHPRFLNQRGTSNGFTFPCRWRLVIPEAYLRGKIHIMTEYKIVVLGAGGVRKSCLTIQLIQKVFMETYDPTVEDSYRTQVTVDDETCLLEILDTANGQEFIPSRCDNMRAAQGFLLVYSITSRTSFNEIPELKDYVCRFKDSEYPSMCIVGNKCDLEDTRQVSPQEGADCARNLGVSFYESSALTRVNVEEVFYDIVRQIRRSSDPHAK
eukprot:TRINITY_DN746_c0_g1_i2.p1 TRINITY_DN746_c0_g1~~TRINITY_DN746_c0_g1_i2.p1  ORF type:complete len:215 (+),score=12.49 TRINITY_DN746_c0_g1_i2:1122-1766(+)